MRRYGQFHLFLPKADTSDYRRHFEFSKSRRILDFCLQALGRASYLTDTAPSRSHSPDYSCHARSKPNAIGITSGLRLRFHILQLLIAEKLIAFHSTGAWQSVVYLIPLPCSTVSENHTRQRKYYKKSLAPSLSSERAIDTLGKFTRNIFRPNHCSSKTKEEAEHLRPTRGCKNVGCSSNDSSRAT